MYESHEYYLRRAIEVSKQSRAAGTRPSARCWWTQMATSRS